MTLKGRGGGGSKVNFSKHSLDKPPKAQKIIVLEQCLLIRVDFQLIKDG